MDIDLAKKQWMVITDEQTGSRRAVPVSVIAEHRARYYAEDRGEFDGDVQRSLDEDTWPLFAGDTYQIEDWASNNMNFEDVEAHARVIPTNRREPDWQEAWVNGAKEFRLIDIDPPGADAASDEQPIEDQVMNTITRTE